VSDGPFSEATLETLAAVLDTLVPPSADGRMPGAGAIGLASGVSERLGPGAPLIESGLAALDGKAGAAGFAALAPEARAEVLRAYETEQPGFVQLLCFQTYTLYYQTAEAVEGLGLDPRPLFPRGFDLEQGDLSLLDGVRERTRLFREA